MSNVYTKQRPMIDWDEFERRLRQPCSTHQMDDDPLAELLHIIGGDDGSDESHCEPINPLSARAQPDPGEPGELNQPEAQGRLIGGEFAAIEAGLLGAKQQAAILPEAQPAPLISGEFAAIEAGLLGAAREQDTATVSEANRSNALPSMDIGSQRFLPQDNQPPVSRHAGVTDGQNGSLLPLYGMVAIIIVAMTGIAVSFALKGRASGPPEIASFKGESEAAKQQTEAVSSANVPVLDAATLSKAPEPPPTALDNGTKQTIDLPQAEEKTLPAESHTQIDSSPPAMPSAPAQTPADPLSMAAPTEAAPAQTPAKPLSMAAPIEAAPPQTPAQPLSMAAPIEPGKMKTDVVGPDGTLPPNATPPQAKINPNINEVRLPAPQSPAVAKTPKAKAVHRVTKPQKPTSARDLGRHGSPRQIAKEAKATPLSPFNTEPAPMADPKAVTPATHPSPATNGAFEFVQSALNSLTSVPAKLLEIVTGRASTH